MSKLTPRQQDVLACIRRYLRAYGVAPTRKEIGRELGIDAVTVQQHVAALRGAGVICVTPKAWRGIALV